MSQREILPELSEVGRVEVTDVGGKVGVDRLGAHGLGQDAVHNTKEGLRTRNE